VLLGLVLLGAATAAVGYLVLSRSYYLGVDGDEVVIFTGTNQEVAGVPLYRVAERTGVSLDDLPVRRQQLVRDGVPEPTLQDARASLTRYQDEAEAEQTPTPAPSPSPSTPTGQPPLDQGVPPPSDPAPAPAP
jgi:PPM family protein phosphatase